METHGTARINRVTKICKLLWQWIALYPSECERPASLLISALPLEMSSASGFASSSVVHNGVAQAGYVCWWFTCCTATHQRTVCKPQCLKPSWQLKKERIVRERMQRGKDKQACLPVVERLYKNTSEKSNSVFLFPLKKKNIQPKGILKSSTCPQHALVHSPLPRACENKKPWRIPNSSFSVVQPHSYWGASADCKPSYAVHGELVEKIIL